MEQAKISQDSTSDEKSLPGKPPSVVVKHSGMGANIKMNSASYPHLKDIENALAAGLDAKIISFAYFSKNKNNCYNYVADLLFCLMDHNKTKDCHLACVLMEHFNEWLINADIAEQLTLQLKVKALKPLGKLRDPELVKLVFAVFKIEEDIDNIRGVIKQLLAQQNITEAFHYVEILKLHKEFSIYEIILPLIFKKKILAHRYLKSCPEFLADTLKALDDACLDRRTMSKLTSCLNVDIGNFCPNQLRKVYKSMLEEYGVEPDENSNLYFVQRRGALDHLLYTRYVQKAVDGSSFEDYVVDLTKHVPKLQIDVLKRIVAKNDGELAVRVAKTLNLPPEEWPKSLCDYFYGGPGYGLFCTDDKFVNDDKNTLELELCFSQIDVVTTKNQFLDFVKDISQHYSVVGFDSEGKPCFIGQSKQSLLQFGVHDKVYLIDLMCLESSLKQQDWNFMFEEIFYNPKILKLGYGVQNDLKSLYKDYLGATKPCNFPLVLDLLKFYDELLLHHPQIASILKKHCATVRGATKKHCATVRGATNANNLKGLSKLCLNVLGRPLSKREQLSNWERRPLTLSQATYAALDAYCLVQIYEKLRCALEEIGLDINDVVPKELMLIKTRKEKQTKTSERKEHSCIENPQEVDKN